MEEKKLFKWLTGKIRRLSHIKRFSSFPVNRQENVSEHSFWVALYSYLIATMMSQQGFKINIDKTVTKAIVHDLEEALTGDIIRSFKYKNDNFRKMSKDIESSLMENEILDGFNKVQKNIIFSNWRNSKDNTIEGRVVAFSDILTVVSYCKEENNLGNKHLHSVSTQTKQYFNDFLRTVRGKKYKFFKKIKDSAFE